MSLSISGADRLFANSMTARGLSTAGPRGGQAAGADARTATLAMEVGNEGICEHAHVAVSSAVCSIRAEVRAGLFSSFSGRNTSYTAIAGFFGFSCSVGSAPAFAVIPRPRGVFLCSAGAGIRRQTTPTPRSQPRSSDRTRGECAACACAACGWRWGVPG